MYEVKIEFKNGSRRTESGMTHAAAWGEYAGQVNGIEMATTGALRVSIMNQDTGRVLARYPMETAPPPKPKGELTDVEITDIQRMLVGVLGIRGVCEAPRSLVSRAILSCFDEVGATSERIHALIRRLNDVAEGRPAPKAEVPKAQAQAQPTGDWITELHTLMEGSLKAYLEGPLGYGKPVNLALDTGPDQKWCIVAYTLSNSAARTVTIEGKGMEGAIGLRETLKGAVAYKWAMSSLFPCKFVGCIWIRTNA